MKAVIPVAGAGVRLRPHTYTQPKPLILVAGKPIISFIIDQLLEAGVDQFVFVLGYLGDKIKAYLETNYPDLSKEYVYQEIRRGLGDAILKTEKSIEYEDEIIILLGDTILDLDMDKFMAQSTSSLAIQKVDDPRLFGVIERDSDGFVKNVVEKPVIPKSNLAIVGLYKIKEVAALLESLKQVQKENDDGYELHLADGLMKMVKQDIQFATFQVNRWYDCGRKDVLLETNKVLLKNNVSEVGTEFIFNHSIIIPPVIYGKSCQFSNSIIGPNVTLGDHVKISNSLISDSIVGNYVNISGTVLGRSVIGNDAAIRGLSHSLNIGDNNEIDFTQ